MEDQLGKFNWEEETVGQPTELVLLPFQALVKPLNKLPKSSLMQDLIQQISLLYQVHKFSVRQNI